MQYREPPRAAVLAALLARAYPNASTYGVACTVQLLQKVAKAHKASAVRECNFPMTEEQQTREDRRLSRLVANVDAQFATMGETDGVVSWRFGGDPRGPCAALLIAGERGDGWGDGFAIY